ncbi:MAG TPA: Uma2 family endonuclease [Promineifilum sp.]|nr:Uma2 family endonuclease [Promineifilum sp.]HRO25490.1 Uma2 family endonuclease [Promineifilum sp.]HRO92189.1 Uma2 family endonuclease [Promineifilum sp.]HRQ14218.1 Uma2 family endonuclease [Promineifilum sp.]
MSSPVVDERLFQQLLQADKLGIRMEIVGGLPLWEASPVLRHQEALDRIRASIRPQTNQLDDDLKCDCFHAADVYVVFPDGSLKRPDIAIYCRRPDEDDEAITLIPEAVIEIISKGYEAKDLEIGPRFYLSQGVKDVIVFDPHTLVVLHLTPTSAARHVSPIDITLACGCACRV